MPAPEPGWIGTHRSQDHLFVLSNRGVSTELSPCQEPPHWEWSPPGSPGTPPLAPQEQQRPHSTRSGDMQLPSPILCPSPSLLSLPLWLPPNPWDCPSGVWWSRGGLLSPPHTLLRVLLAAGGSADTQAAVHILLLTLPARSVQSLALRRGRRALSPPAKAGVRPHCTTARTACSQPAAWHGSARLGSAPQGPRLPATLQRAGTKPQVHRPVPRGAAGCCLLSALPWPTGDVLQPPLGKALPRGRAEQAVLPLPVRHPRGQAEPAATCTAPVPRPHLAPDKDRPRCGAEQPGWGRPGAPGDSGALARGACGQAVTLLPAGGGRQRAQGGL